MTYRMKSLCILLFFTVFLGAYSLPSKAQIKELKTVNIVDIDDLPGFQTPMVFMGVPIEEIDTNAKNPVAKAALGIEGGKPINKDRVASELKLSSGTSLYEINPVLPHDNRSRFFVTTNDETHAIETVRILQMFDSVVEAELAKENVVNIIKQNYILVFQDNDLEYLKNKHGDLIIIYIHPVEEQFELRFLYISDIVAK